MPVTPSLGSKQVDGSCTCYLLAQSWSGNVSDCLVCCRQLVVVYTDKWYTCYRGQLYGSKEVAVQIPFAVSGGHCCACFGMIHRTSWGDHAGAEMCLPMALATQDLDHAASLGLHYWQRPAQNPKSSLAAD